MIIRLIDVVLILLFGFIKISEIVFYSQIKLPASEQSTEQQKDDKDQIIVTVQVYSKLNKNNGTVIMKFVIPEGKEEHKFVGLMDLEDYLVTRAEKNKGKPFLVLCDPIMESRFQPTSDVRVLCKNTNFEKSIHQLYFSR